jgi:hypothetical protein
MELKKGLRGVPQRKKAQRAQRNNYKKHGVRCATFAHFA